MVGEFYTGTLLGLHALLTAKTKLQHANHHSNDVSVSSPHNATSDNAIISFIDKMQSSNEATQFYVHIPHENKQILDAHRLLLSGMLPFHHHDHRANNNHTQWAKSALALVSSKQKKCQ